MQKKKSYELTLAIFYIKFMYKENKWSNNTFTNLILKQELHDTLQYLRTFN